MSERAEEFFVVGGTMRPLAASYILRPADDDLFARLLAGEFCYVLTARQMGKSSLMVRTARRLAEHGVRSVVIDLTAIGTVGVDAWYLGLLSALRSQLRLKAEPAGWWAERAGQSAPQRFRAFLREIALAQIDAPLVVFVDEIDSTLALPFRDDFFAALRAMFNEREAEPAFQRLTFALLGVAAPTDLIRDQSRTPFNIGWRISLGELSLADAAPMREALESLFPGQGEQLLGRVFHWTGGHPYLTQKLCAAAAREQTARWDNAAVDALVARDVLDERAGDENLKFVQNRVRGTPEAERRAMLQLYRRVYRGKRVPDDDGSIIQNRLELTGIVAVDGGALKVRNAIYRRAFDERWIAATLPPDNQRRLAIGAALIALALVLALIIAQSFLPQPADSLAQGYVDIFESTLKVDNPDSHTKRLDSLYRLFLLKTYRGRQLALGEFYDRLSPEQQENLFKRADASDSARFIHVTREIAATLAWDGNGADLRLLNAMIAGLERMPQPAASAVGNLQLILPVWRQGREEMNLGNYGQAVNRFNQASALDGSVETMPAFLYDRAIARARLAQPDTANALRDLDTMLAIAEQEPTPVPATLTPTPPTRTSQFSAPSGAPRATPGAVTPGAGPGSAANGEGDGFAPTATPDTTVAPDPLGNTRRFRTREQISATVSELLTTDPALREAYRATLGSGTYPRLEQAVAILPLPDTPTAAPAATAILDLDTLAQFQAIVIDTPPSGTQVHSPMVLTGRTNLFPNGGQLEYRVINSANQLIGTGVVRVDGGPGQRGSFVAELTFNEPPDGDNIRVEVADRAANGAMIASTVTNLFVAPPLTPQPGSQSLTPSPTPQPIPNITPAADLRPAISDVVDLLPTSSPPFEKRGLSDIDTIVFRATDSSPNLVGLAGLRAFAKYNIEFQQFPGISYHFVIDRDGTVYKTNQLETISYHSAEYNRRSIGVALVTFMNFSGPRLTDAQMGSTARLSAWLLSDFRLPLSALKDRSDINPQRIPTGLDYTTLRADVQRLLDSAKITLPASAPVTPTATPGL